MSQKLFGTDGIRGKANAWPITPEIAMRTGRAIARVVKKNQGAPLKAIIGKDTRLSGYMLETALTAGLVSEGAKVHLTGPIPTPAIAYLTHSMQCDAGIMLTASHNPYEDNGIKIFRSNGFKLTDEQEAEIEELILADSLAEPEVEIGKAFRVHGATGRYIEFVKNTAGVTSLKGLKIVVDCAHGAAYEVGPTIFSELGAEVISLNTKPNGKNINLDCGALYPETTAKIVREQNADIGICFDGDADRVIFIDEKGKVIPGDNILGLSAIALKKRNQLNKDTLVVTVMSNLGLRDCLNTHGIKMVTTAVGDRHVVEAMRAEQYSIGGENSGHIIFAKNATTGDGIMSSLQILSILKSENKTLSDLASCVQHYPQELHAIAVTEKPAIESIPELTKSINEAENSLAENGRVLVRYSGTEKKIRVLVEAKDASAAKSCSDLICNAIANTIGA